MLTLDHHVIPVNSPDIAGLSRFGDLCPDLPDSYLKSPDIKVVVGLTADRTAFAWDMLVPGSDTRCLCLQIVPATPSERAETSFLYTFKMASRGEKTRRW